MLKYNLFCRGRTFPKKKKVLYKEMFMLYYKQGQNGNKQLFYSMRYSVIFSSYYFIGQIANYCRQKKLQYFRFQDKKTDK